MNGFPARRLTIASLPPREFLIFGAKGTISVFLVYEKIFPKVLALVDMPTVSHDWLKTVGSN